MTLKELQQMIKEELDNYVNEADDMPDVAVSDDDVDVDGEMDGKEAEDTLRKIYDMLKDKFEAEKEDDMDDMDEMSDMEEAEMEEAEMEEDMVGEVKDDEKKDEAADMEEGSDGYDGSKNSAGPNAGYSPAKTTKGDGKLHEKALQERFQKLANIIK